MKKILGILGAISLVSTIGIQTIACQNKSPKLNLENYRKRNLDDLVDILDAPETKILKKFNQLNNLQLVLNKDVIVEDISTIQAVIRAQPKSKTVTGKVVVEFWLSSIKFQPTKYLDKNGEEKATDKQDLSEEDISIITQIGFYANRKIIQVVQMPETLKEIRAKLPRQITSLDKMFFNCFEFNQNISAWDVSRVTSMYLLFSADPNEGANTFNQDISAWDVSNVTDMSFMFASNINFDNGGKPLSWNKKQVRLPTCQGCFWMHLSSTKTFLLGMSQMLKIWLECFILLQNLIKTLFDEMSKKLFFMKTLPKIQVLKKNPKNDLNSIIKKGQLIIKVALF